MKIQDLTWTRYVHAPLSGWDEPDVQHVAEVGDGIHRFSVLDRMTGFSFGRDVETAFRSLDGSTFWLRSGQFDVRDYPDLSIDEAIVLLKSEALDHCGPPRIRLRDVAL